MLHENVPGISVVTRPVSRIFFCWKISRSRLSRPCSFRLWKVPSIHFSTPLDILFRFTHKIYSMGLRIPDTSKYFCSFTPTKRKNHSPNKANGFFFLSECRDSNPDRMLPKHECYRYTTLRYFDCLQILAQICFLWKNIMIK